MSRFALRLAPCLTLFALTAGCSDDCVSSCEAKQDCADATDVEKKMNCDKTCDDLDDIGESSSCDSRIEEYTSCESDIDDVCKDDSKCDAKFEAAIACLIAYCEARPNDAECVAVGADFGIEL